MVGLVPPNVKSQLNMNGIWYFVVRLGLIKTFGIAKPTMVCLGADNGIIGSMI